MNGFVHVTAAREKTIEGIRVSLVGRQKLYFPSDGGRAEDTEILMREIVLGGPGTDGIQLKAGLNRRVGHRCSLLNCEGIRSSRLTSA